MSVMGFSSADSVNVKRFVWAPPNCIFASDTTLHGGRRICRAMVFRRVDKAERPFLLSIARHVRDAFRTAERAYDLGA